VLNPYSAYGITPNFQLGTTGSFTPQPGMFAGGASPSVRLDPRAQQALSGEAGVPGNINLSGVSAPPQPGASQRIREGVKSAAGKGQEFLNVFMQGASALPVGRLGAAAGMVAPVVEAIGEAQAGRPVGALGAVGGGAVGVGIGAAAARFIPGRMGKIAGAVLPAVGGLIGAPTGAQAAESVRQKITGEPTKGKEGDFTTQMAMAQQINELGATQYRDQMGTYTSALKDLSKHYSDQQYYDLQRNMPLIEKMKNSELVRQQALNAHMAQQQAMLGTLATGGALAQGAQAESGATLRTALTAAPYAGSVLQAPQIRFG
jgi:hypothetical protein